MTKTIQLGLVKLTLALSLLGATAAHAATFDYNVFIDTSALAYQAGVPYSLDFNLNWGGTGTQTNTVTLDNFIFIGTGAGAVAAPQTYGSGASGDLLTQVTLSANAVTPFSELSQAFNPATTGILFSAHVSQNATGTTPDGFLVDIFDSGGANIATTAGDGISLLTLAIGNQANVIGDVNTFTSGTGVEIVSVLVSIPEPSLYAALLGTAALAVAALRRRRDVLA